ncbi:hypothetical protein IEQ34_026381 [Dendrobium chrysotoxum]|uniref:Uncharacterized protein n=1 Tax=Dendrobium chrysotoxum TaxID=161865 RepID=A0AAV7FMA1_DENCH|nr:hypothetical protein IEQ34_026381 [Dendrobium chrysotoxum]
MSRFGVDEELASVLGGFAKSEAREREEGCGHGVGLRRKKNHPKPPSPSRFISESRRAWKEMKHG